jgi:hypothetical protein
MKPLKTAEEFKADRLAREAAEREALTDKFLRQKTVWSGLFITFGALLLFLGAWLLIIDPGDVSGVNLQKLYVGQTSAIVGAILLATGVLLKYLD